MSNRKTYRLSGGLFEREEESAEAKRLFFLSVEGARTEPSYFGNLNKALKELGVNDVYIHVLRHPKDGLSSPEDVYSLVEECMQARENCEFLPVPVKEELLREFSEDNISEMLGDSCGLPFDMVQKFNAMLLHLGINVAYRKYIINCPSQSDRFAVVFDRDCGSHSRESLEAVISKAAEKNVICCLTNPCFDFWLLLHLVESDSLIKDDVLDKIKANQRISKRHTYVSAWVSHLAKHTKRIPERAFAKFYKPNLKRAIERVQYFATEANDVLDNVGSTMPLLLKEIF